jgi:hypothetical protein
MKSILALGMLAALVLPLSISAAPRDDLLAQYANAAKQASPGFSGFSAARGEKLHLTKFTGGKAETPSCTNCHGDNPRSAGRTLTGKSIEPIALSASPARYSDPLKVEKWFRRNCNEVLGHECTPLEKGDWLSFMITQ